MGIPFYDGKRFGSGDVIEGVRTGCNIDLAAQWNPPSSLDNQIETRLGLIYLMYRKDKGL